MEQERIIPAHAIDGYQLNWTLDELKSQLKSGYEVEKHEYCWLIYYQNYSFWFDLQKGKIVQIGVNGNYNGTFNNIGIGSTLTDVKEKYGSWEEGLDVYLLPKVEGLCFELADNEIDEEWIEEEAPIEAIYVYNPKDFDVYGDLVYGTVTRQYVDKRQSN